MDTTPVATDRRTAGAAEVPDTLRSFRTGVDRLFDRFTNAFGLPISPFRTEAATAPVPRVELSDGDQAFTLTAELPGVDSKDLTVSLADDVLVIRGEKRQERQQADKDYHLTERSYGAFRRSFALPPSVRRDGITADFANGVLTVTLPKAADSGAKEIPVKSAC